MYSLMKNYQPLDPKLFKAFMAAARTENFTGAAEKANMTQSGVSQHIAKLEEQIGLSLFKRIGKRVVLTDTGKKLAKYITEQTYSADVFLDTVRDQHENLAGLVSYAMPSSCLMSPHFPMLLERRKKYTDITLDVTLTPSSEVIQMVLNNQLDFGFVTQKIEHPLLDFDLFCQEEYIMVGSAEDDVKGLTPENILKQRYIHYPGADVYYNFWLKHYCPDRPHIHSLSLPASGNINSIPGAVAMVVGGLGYGVFPRHCVEEMLNKGILHECQSRQPLLNDINIVKIANHQYPRRVERVIEWFFEMK